MSWAKQATCRPAGSSWRDYVRTEPDLVRTPIGVAGQFSAVGNLLTGRENLLLMADMCQLDRRERRSAGAELVELKRSAGKPAAAPAACGAGRLRG